MKHVMAQHADTDLLSAACNAIAALDAPKCFRLHFSLNRICLLTLCGPACICVLYGSGERSQERASLAPLHQKRGLWKGAAD